MRFFTVCSNNYLAFARTLGSQIAKHHPDSEFTIFLADKSLGYEVADVGYRVVPMDRLGLVEELAMITRYNITELNTAIKPWCFRYLFSEGADPVTYLDPDVMVISPLLELEEASQNFDAILTPHITRPATDLGYKTANFLRLGIYNLGFLCLRPSPDTEDFLSWWAEQLETECVIDLANGIFVDQKWADFIPAFVENTKVLRHPGYNVAYWNIHNRKLVEHGDEILSNGEILRFVHFSGLPSDASNPAISAQMPDLTELTHPVLGKLAKDYRSLLDVNGQKVYSQLRFSYFVTPRGERNEHRPHLREDQSTFLRREETYFVVRTFRSTADYRDFKSCNEKLFSDRASTEAQLRSGCAELGYVETVNPVDQSRCRLFLGAEGWPNFEAENGLTTNERLIAHVFVQELQPGIDSRLLVQSADERLTTMLASRFPNSMHRYQQQPPADASADVVLNPRGVDQKAASEAQSLLAPSGYYLVASDGDISDSMALLRQAGFINPVAFEVWSSRFGYVQESRFVVACQKPIGEPLDEDQ